MSLWVANCDRCQLPNVENPCIRARLDCSFALFQTKKNHEYVSLSRRLVLSFEPIISLTYMRAITIIMTQLESKLTSSRRKNGFLTFERKSVAVKSINIKPSCHIPFRHAFAKLHCILEEITLDAVSKVNSSKMR